MKRKSMKKILLCSKSISRFRTISAHIRGGLPYCGLLLFVCALSAPYLYSQAVGGGQIQGTITDATGAAVAGATVEVIQTDSGLHRTVISGADGGYSLPDLPVGPYQLNVTGAGFGASHQVGIVLQVGNNLRMDVKLSVGTNTQSVEVDAGAPQVQMDDQSVSQVIDKQRTVDLPLNGRQATQLILLTGAATTAPSGDLVGTKNYPSSVALSVAGGQGTTTNYLMDGADNNDAFTNVNLPFPFPDALQEFSVQTSGLAAQYGLHPGAVVNVVTASGGNAFHGTLFDFFRNGALNATNYFSTSKDSLKRNQFGGTIGGPIIKNKLFFFFGYQGTQTRQQSASTKAYVPTKAMLNGDFSAFDGAGCQTSGKAKVLRNPATGQPYQNNQIDPSTFNSSALAFLKYMPVATNPCGQVSFGAPNPQSENQYIGRVDWNMSEKQSLFVRYFNTHFNQPGFFGGNLLNTANPALNDQAQSAVIGHTYTLSSNLVNSFHVNATRNYIARGSASDLINPQSLGIQVNSPIPNYIFMNVVNDFSVACGTCENYRVATTTYNVVDDVFLTRAKHRLGFGISYEHSRLNLQGTNNANGQFTFNGNYTSDPLVDFMLGDIYTLYQGNNTGSGFSRNYIGLYAQDSWQASQRLTINAGIRWESDLPEVETNGRGATFSQAAFNAGTISTVYPTAPAGMLFYGDKGVPHGYINNHYDHFEPRVGFAFDPRGKGKESIRGSYSMGFQTPVLYLENRFENMAPFGDSLTLTDPAGGLTNPYAGYPGGNPFPQPYPPPHATAFFPTQSSLFVFPTNLKPSYTQTWNLSIEKQFGNWILTSTYLGDHVLHIWGGNELNPTVYIPGNCGANPCSISSGSQAAANIASRRTLTRINPAMGPYYSGISQEYDGASGKYNGVLTSLQHRFAQHYTVLANYTYSHCLSGATDGGDLGGDVFQNPANPNADYSNCGFDIRHNFVTSVVVRSEVKGSPLRRAMLSGWQLAPIVAITSGAPFTPLTGTDQSMTAVGLDRPNLVGNPYAHTGGRTQWLNGAAFLANPVGTFGTTRPYSLRAPSYFDFDTAATKYVPFHEKDQLEIRTECFNCFNHPNLEAPNATLSSGSSFGKIQLANPPRIIQLSLKIDF
jgi:hypothetical protein